MRAKVETLRVGDRIYLPAPGKNPAGYLIERVETYETLGVERVKCFVVIYRDGPLEHGLVPMRAGDRVPARRAADS